jgi:hypothetical protein
LRVAVLSQNFGPLHSTADVQVDSFIGADTPTAEQLGTYDVTICIGSFEQFDRAAHLGGALRLALDRGATVVFAYNGRIANHDRELLRPMFTTDTYQLSGGFVPVASEPAPHRVFRDYFTEYGRGDQYFPNPPDRAEVLGEKIASDSPYTTQPCAFAAPIGEGSLYVLPYHLAADAQAFIERLMASVFAHREEFDDSAPSFFAEIELPGEVELAREIESVRADLAEKEARIADLRHHKQLVGRLAGSALEDLVIEELNLVLAGSGAEARDTPELRNEDFELVADGGRVAIAESKAESGGVGFANVNQLNNARSALDLGVDEMPAVLVINPFRNDDGAERRKERLEERLVRHACRQNVLVLRTWDLYELVARRLDGKDDAAALRAAIVGGGGWLEATSAGIRHHQA